MEDKQTDQLPETRRPFDRIVSVLERIADALERAYPKPPDETKKFGRGVKKTPRFPVVMWSSVPQHAKQQRENKSQYEDDDRCVAAIRPWVNGMGEPNEWARCSRKKKDGDCICGEHRNHAQVTGIKTWAEVSR